VSSITFVLPKTNIDELCGISPLMRLVSSISPPHNSCQKSESLSALHDRKGPHTVDTDGQDQVLDLAGASRDCEVRAT
jgi:hypothetical protein